MFKVISNHLRRVGSVIRVIGLFKLYLIIHIFKTYTNIKNLFFTRFIFIAR